MIIEDYFTRHTGDTSFFYLDMNAIVDISLTHFFFYIVEMEIRLSRAGVGGRVGSAVFKNFLFRRMYTCIRGIIKPISNAYRIKFFSKNRYLKFKSEPY